MSYLYERQDRDGIIEANRLLYPAYGTYVGNSLGLFSPAQAMPIFYAVVAAGHLNGRMLSHDIDQHLREYQTMFASNDQAELHP